MDRKDNIKFLCDISELSGIFRKSKNLENFLQRIVEMVSEHMKSDVCSIYLYDENKKILILSATTGLNKKLINGLHLKANEGLIGLSFEGNCPVFEKSASQNPNYRYVAELGEDKYESFVAVPIVKGNFKIGVMVIQNTVKDYFLEEDVKVLQAITSQLANSIEMTRFIMSIENKERVECPEKSEPVPPFIKGKAGSSGFAYANVIVFNVKNNLRYYAQKITRRYHLKEFHLAVTKTEKQLEDYQCQLEERYSDVASLIFTAQILMLKDKAFIDDIISLINGGMNPPAAIVEVVEKFIKKFEGIANPYLQEKSHDIRDVGMRLLENLMVNDEIDAFDYQGRIVIARELLPSDILKMSLLSIEGIILLSGGVTSHLSILAGSLRIPLIIADHESLFTLTPKDKVILDAHQGNIYINPSPDIIDNFKNLNTSRLNFKDVPSCGNQEIKDVTFTKDKEKVFLKANINLLSDLKIAVTNKAEGIGLYRTEFPFIVRSTFPSEEEQYVIYKKLIDGFKGKEVNFRTLDIGGDKVLSYYNYHTKEKNPFLGLRSIRFSLKNKKIFIQQIRAILRAGHDSDIKIMFPMISSVNEFLDSKEIVWECIESLKNDQIACHDSPKVGMMIEIPSVIELIDDFAKHVDFFSIGTNDFIQYMLAVDRTNEKVMDMYIPHHPSILRSLNRIFKAAASFNVDISICGEMANEVKYLKFLLGVGFRTLSINPFHLPEIQKEISKIDVKDSQRYAKALLKMADITEISQYFSN